jgi:hypothetical protein
MRLLPRLRDLARGTDTGRAMSQENVQLLDRENAEMVRFSRKSYSPEKQKFRLSGALRKRAREDSNL